MKQLFNSIIVLILLATVSCSQEDNLTDSDIACINCAEEFVVLWETWDTYAKKFDENISSGKFVFSSQQKEDAARLMWVIEDEEQRLQKLTDFRVANLACLKLDKPEAMYEYLDSKWQRFKQKK